MPSESERQAVKQASQPQLVCTFRYAWNSLSSVKRFD